VRQGRVHLPNCPRPTRGQSKGQPHPSSDCPFRSSTTPQRTNNLKSMDPDRLRPWPTWTSGLVANGGARWTLVTRATKHLPPGGLSQTSAFGPPGPAGVAQPSAPRSTRPTSVASGVMPDIDATEIVMIEGITVWRSMATTPTRVLRSHAVVLRLDAPHRAARGRPVRRSSRPRPPGDAPRPLSPVEVEALLCAARGNDRHRAPRPEAARVAGPPIRAHSPVLSQKSEVGPDGVPPRGM